MIVLSILLINSTLSANNSKDIIERPYTNCVLASAKDPHKARIKCLQNMELNDSVKAEIKNLELARINNLPLPENKKNILRSMNDAFISNVAYLPDDMLIKLSTAPQIDMIKLESLNRITLQEIGKLNLNEYLKLISLPVTELQNLESIDEIRQLLSSFARHNFQPARYTRSMSKQEFEEFERGYLQEKLKYLRAKEDVSHVKSSLSRSRNEYLQCASGDEFQTCTVERDKLVDDIEDYIEGILKLSEIQLRKISQKLGSSKKITANEYQLANEQISEQIKKLSNMRERIEAMTTADELKSTKDELSYLWDESQTIAKLYATKLLLARIDDLVESSTQSRQKIACILVKAKTRDQDITSILNQYNSYDLLLTQSQSLIINAKERLREIEAHEDIELELLEIKADTLQAYYLLSKGHLDFKNIVRKSQSIGININSCEDVDEDVSQPELIQWCTNGKQAKVSNNYQESCI